MKKKEVINCFVAVKKGHPRTKFTFKVKEFSDGTRSTIYVLRKDGEPTRVFHTVKEKWKIIHHHEKFVCNSRNNSS